MRFFYISTYILCCLLFSCFENTAQEANKNIDYRGEMRNLVIEISKTAKAENPNFIVIPQNGVELVTRNAKNRETIALDYLFAIDAVAQEDLFYGYPKINKPTFKDDNVYLRKYLNLAKDHERQVLVIDYTSSSKSINNSYLLNKENNYTSFAASRRELDQIPTSPVFNENKEDIKVVAEAQNFLYLLNYAEYSTKQELIAELSFTNYDLLVLDLFFQDQAFTYKDIERLKKKKNGGDRLVIAYMSIGEAENYRYYWEEYWSSKPPKWLVEENPDWKGNFKLEYWNDDWKKIIYRSENAYLTKITKAGFDGVYLDIIDGFEYFEAKK